MTNVLTFSRARRQSGATTAAESQPSAGQAEILLFTGVRYERHAEGGSPDTAGNTSGGDDGQTPGRRKARRRA
jgi:hypothetical protein